MAVIGKRIMLNLPQDWEKSYEMLKRHLDIDGDSAMLRRCVFEALVTHKMIGRLTEEEIRKHFRRTK